MFGLYRTMLAFMVMTAHLFSGGPFGRYAVFGFYILSGYLMTLIMHESYGYRPRGMLNYSINRFLRLYPLYWIACLFSVALIFLLGSEFVRSFHASIYLPSDAMVALENITMIFYAWHPQDINPRLVPPTWALTVEIFFYVLIGLGISKSYRRALVWLGFSILYVIFTFAMGYTYADRYLPVAAASLPFSIGALLYFSSKNDDVRDALARIIPSSTVLFSAMLGNAVFWYVVDNTIEIGIFMEVGFYFNVLICAALTFSLILGGKFVNISQRMDRIVGDFAYPVYLLHWQTGLVITYLLFNQPVLELVSIRSGIVFVVSVFTVCALSFLLIKIIDEPVQKIRARVKRT